MTKGRIIVFLIAFTVLLMTSFTVYATEGYQTTDIPADMDTDVIKETIANDFNGLYGSDLSKTITPADIDLSNMYKIYNDTNIFELKTNNFNEIHSILDKASFVFELPVYMDNEKTIVALIQRNLPLPKNVNELMDEEEIEKYEQTVGGWGVPGFTIFSSYADYYSVAEEATGIKGYKPLLVGALPCFNYVVALYPNGNGEVGTLVPILPEAIDTDISGRVPTFFSKLPDNIAKWNPPADEAKRAEALRGYISNLYYLDIKTAVNATPQDFGGGGGGGSYLGVNKTPFVIFFVALGILIATIVFRKLLLRITG